MPLDLSKSPPFSDLIADSIFRAREVGDDWLVDLIARAQTRFSTAGWPHARTESWKYTNLNVLAAEKFSLASTSDGIVPENRVLSSDAPRVVLVKRRIKHKALRPGAVAQRSELNAVSRCGRGGSG